MLNRHQCRDLRQGLAAPLLQASGTSSASSDEEESPAAAPTQPTAPATVASEQEAWSQTLAASLPQSQRIHEDDRFGYWDDDPYIPAGAESDDDDPDGPFSVARSSSAREHTETATSAAPDDDQPPPYADHRRFNKSTATTPVRHTAIIVSLILALAASTAALTLPATPLRHLLTLIHAVLIAHAAYRLF